MTTPYSPSYSFSNWQALNPDRPLPGPEVDDEFAALAASVAALIAALADVRRADGQLENGSVSFDSLDAQVKALLQTADPRVVVPDLAPSAFAAQVEAEAGAANDKIMTPLRTAQALDALRALATQAQAEAGTNNTAVLTSLRGAQLVAALRPFATQGEAEAGVSSTTVLSPARLVQALAALRPAFTATVNLTWGALTAGTASAQNVTVTGAEVQDRVVLGLPSTALAAGLIPTAWVASANTVSVRIHNSTAGTLTPWGGSSTPIAVTCLRY
jgi:hypothetical protein